MKMHPFFLGFFLILSVTLLRAVDVSVVAIDAWGNKFGSGDPIAFTVARTGSTASALTVNLSVSGSATPGTDYPAISSTLTIAAGQASRVVTITPDITAPDRVGTPPSIVVNVAAGSYIIDMTRATATAYIAPSSYSSGGEDMQIQMRKVTTTSGGNYELQIPQRNGADIPVIRGILLSAPGDGGTDASGDFDRWCYDNHFAFLNQKFADDVASKPITALNALATTSGHPEVRYAPICARGFSRGGGLASNMAKDYPARVIAFYARGWSQSKWSNSAPFSPTVATANVPGWFDQGAEDSYAGVVRTGFDRGRAVGALWSYSEYNGEGHGMTVASDMARAFFDICIPLRYDYQPGVAGKDPVLGAVTLTTLTESSGWIGEHLYGKNRNAWTDTYSAEIPNWYRDFETRNPFVCEFSAFDRTDSTVRQHSWFPNERMARLWAQHTGMGWDSIAMQFTHGSTYLVNAGQSLPCILDTGGFPEAVKAEFFVNETKVAESTTQPFSHTFVVTTPGSHYLWARATSANGAVRVTSGHAFSQAGYGERVIRVRPSSELGNTAPTITPIPKIVLRNGDATGVTIPFTIADAETAAANLIIDNAYWRIDYPFGGTWAITGSGANRQLTIKTGGPGASSSDVGFYRGSIKVSDGFLSTDQAIEIEIRPAIGSNAPVFVRPSNGDVAINAADSMWSDTNSFMVSDGNTNPSQLLASFTNSNFAKLPAANIRLSQWGPVRSLRVRTVPDGWNGTDLRLSVNDGSTTTTASSDAYFANVPEQKPNEAPWLATIPPQSTAQGSPTAPQILRLGDLNWLPDELVVTATSSNPTLLPNANIVITKLGNPLIDRDRSLVCQPIAGQSGTATVTVTVTEPAPNSVAPFGPLSSTRTFVLTVTSSGVLITGPAPVGGVVGTAYNHTFTATGAGPITYTVTSGALPGGLSLSSAGIISGTPTTPGTFAGIITASNGSVPNETQNFSMVITAAPTAPVITSIAPATGTRASSYSHTFTASGTPTITYAVSSGTLPAGLSLSSSGILGGTPSAAGSFSFSVTASNSVGTSPSVAVSLMINKTAQTITFANPGARTVGDPSFSLDATASSGLPVSYASSNTDVATVSGNTVTIIGAGSTTITASQAGNANYTPAVNVPQVLTVSLVSQSGTLLEWTTYAAPNGSTTPRTANSRNANLVASSATLSAGPGFAGSAYSNWPSNMFMADTGNPPTNLADAVSKNVYATITITPAAGKIYSLSNISFYAYDWNNQAPTSRAQLAFSEDGFTTYTTIGTALPIAGPGAQRSVNTSGIAALQSVAAAREFRVYFYGYDQYSDVGLGGNPAVATPAFRFEGTAGTPAPPTALATFRTANGLATDGSQDALTPAGDGVQNLLKYAFNMLGDGTGQVPALTTPNAAILDAAGTAGLPLVSIGTGPDAGKLQITYIRRKTAATPAPGVTYAVEFSDGLTAWDINIEASVNIMNIDNTLERVTVTDSINLPLKRFARVLVTTN